MDMAFSPQSLGSFKLSGSAWLPPSFSAQKAQLARKYRVDPIFTEFLRNFPDNSATDPFFSEEDGDNLTVNRGCM
jgi:hypothetical protein